MLSDKNLLLKTLLSCFIIIQMCVGKKTHNYCPPSSCANIPNISYPFRLKNDPFNCGDHHYELDCENNNTLVLYLNDSQKYVVQAINYPNHTIRLAYPSILESDNCSLPNYSTPMDKFRNDYPYRIRNYEQGYDVASFITFMSCLNPVNKSLVLEAGHSGLRNYGSNETGDKKTLFLEAGDCGLRNYGFNESGDKKHTYVVFGELNAFDIKHMCTVDLMVMTSLTLKAEKSVSLSEIHSSLLYGFEILWPDIYRCTVTWLEIPCDGLPIRFINAILAVFPPPLIALLAVASLAIRSILGMSCMLWLLIYRFRKWRLSMFDLIEGFLQTNHNLMPIRYSYRDIKKMTRGFKEKLGQGGYGSVYKGKLRSGHIVAVKLLLNKPKENGQDFINEIATIGRIHHVNVVKLVGFCAGRFNKKRALVFDFMPNGSLEKHIFTQQSPNLLSWEKKYEIAVGVARGIEYLHRGCDIQILHFDIKPHNILLDENFTPKISDFGLAKLYATDNNTVTLTAARGTIGYLAPELFNRSLGGVSYKADVYSFGMLLIEMVGLNKHIKANDEESSQYFPDWIYKGLNKSEDIETGAADIIEDNDNDNDAKRITRKMTVVGLWCIQMSPADRPSMGEVVKMLESRNANIQIPPHPSEQTPTANNSDHARGTESSGSMGDYTSSSGIEMSYPV